MMEIDGKDRVVQMDAVKRGSLPINDGRNLVIIAGQNAVGKTTALNVLIEGAREEGISFYPHPVSDLFFMLDVLGEDDKQGGFNHYHDWCARKEGEHCHSEGESHLPFTVTSNKLVDAMFDKFFDALEHAPEDKFLFVEWTGGRNINCSREPASKADFSFARIGRMLQGGKLPAAWLDRVCAFIHPIADNLARYALNERKLAASIEEIATGTISPKKSSTVLGIFGEDDFYEIENLLEDRGIPERRIFSIKNDKTSYFHEQLRRVAKEIFSQVRGLETQVSHRIQEPVV